MKLSIPERVALMELMRDNFQTESYSGMREVRRTMLLLQFRDEEMDKFNIRVSDNSVVFDKEKASGYTVEVPIGEWMTSEIRKALLEKDRNRELKASEIDLFEKFVMDFITL